MLGMNSRTGEVNVMPCQDAIKLHLQLLTERRDLAAAESKQHSSRWSTPEYNEGQDRLWMNKELQAQAELERAVNLGRSAGLRINEKYEVTG